jgi:hypothetical protein
MYVRNLQPPGGRCKQLLVLPMVSYYVLWYQVVESTHCLLSPFHISHCLMSLVISPPPLYLVESKVLSPWMNYTHASVIISVDHRHRPCSHCTTTRSSDFFNWFVLVNSPTRSTIQTSSGFRWTIHICQCWSKLACRGEGGSHEVPAIFHGDM